METTIPPALWSQFGEETTISSLRQPPSNTTIYNVATDISADVTYLCKLTQLSYVNDKPNHILHDRRWYEQTTHQGTYRSFMSLSLTNRRVLYEKHETNIDSILIYTPVNVNNTTTNNLTTDIPIYVIFRGTDSIWDVFKDLNLLYNYTTGSNYDASGIQTLVTQIGSYLENQIFNSYSENVVFLSHSLGSKIALNVMHGFKDTIHINRIKHNVMFNPFIVVDNIYESALNASNDYKTKFEAFIIDGDFASIIYKNHPIGQLFTFGNIVPEGSWIQQIQNLTRQQYLNVQNHNLNAFTNSTDSYPDSTFVHYEPDLLQDKQISSVRTFGLTAYDSSLTQEEIYLRKRPTESEWKVGNINVDSNHISDYDIDIRVASEGKTDMIWLNGYWSYPLEFGVMVSGTLTWDLSNIFYMVRAYNEQSEQSYYMIGIFNNAIKYYRTRHVQDYSTALTNQDKNNLNNAFALEDQTALTTAQALGQNSLTHKSYRWFINNPDLPNHTGYAGGLRRNLITQEISLRPIHGNFYRLKNKGFSTRYLTINRVAGGSDEGTVTAVTTGSVWTPPNGVAQSANGDIFKCFYDTNTQLYSFLDITYLEMNSTGPFINSAHEVYIGESNVTDYTVNPTTIPNAISFHLDPDTVTNTTEYFGMRNDSNNKYFFIHDIWSAWDSTHDGYGSIDPLGYFTAPLDVNSLWKFEEVEYQL